MQIRPSQAAALARNGFAAPEGGLKQGLGSRHGRGEAAAGGVALGFPFFSQQRVLMRRIDNELMTAFTPARVQKTSLLGDRLQSCLGNMGE